MSDEHTDATAAADAARAERAAGLASQAQALFESAKATDESDLPTEAGQPQETDEPAETDEGDPEENDPEENEAEGDAAVTDDETETETEPQPAATQSPFGLIFQAPDLSDLPRRRSRRAVSGVTTPSSAPVVSEGSEPKGEDERADEQAGEQDHPATSGTDSDESGTGRGGNRRRRGGKGRRGRSGSSDDGEQGGEGRADGTATDSDRNNDNDNDNGNDTATDTASTQDAAASADEQQQSSNGSSRRRSRSRRGTRQSEGEDANQSGQESHGHGDGDSHDDGEDGNGTRRRRRRRRGEAGSSERSARDEVTSVRGSTRLEAKRQRRREGREAGRRRTIITEAEFLARRESVDRVMAVRGLEDRTQIGVLEDGVPVEHYVSRSAQSTMVGNVYLGRVQNVLPSMEAAFVDIGKGRNAVLYAGEVNWDAAGLGGNDAKRIENALKSGESVLVQVTKDPIGHKGARLTSQISLPGRFLVYVPGNSMTGISRKLPENERARLKKILKEVLPDDAGVIVRTAAEGASEAELRADVERLTSTWERIQAKSTSASAPALLHGEPDMTVRVIRDVFTEDFSKLVVSGEQAWTEVKRYIDDVAPDLADRVEKYTGTNDIFTTYRVSEAIAKAMDRKVWLPSGGSLVIDRTEAMTVIDVNTGKFTGSGGNLEETVTKNNIEAAEEIVRQLRLRDIGGIIVIDFIDMVLESNRDLVVRRLLECLGRDRTKHQVAEVTSLGLVQMTRKRVGSGLIDVFSETCTHCAGRGIIVHPEPIGKGGGSDHEAGNGSGGGSSSDGSGRGRGRGRRNGSGGGDAGGKGTQPAAAPAGPTPAQIAAAAHAAAMVAGMAPSGEAGTEPSEAEAEVVAVEPAEAVTGPAEPAEPAEPAIDETPAPAAKRRRRGRVSAPAGPPTHSDSDSDSDSGSDSDKAQ